MEVNTILHTKDGREIGNAIVIKNEGNFNIVKTDYGNEVKLTDREIEKLFYVAHLDEPEELRSFAQESHKYSVNKSK